MLLLAVGRGSSLKRLALQTGLSQGVISSRIDRLQRLGLLSRPPAQSRLTSIELLPAGQEILAILVRTVERSAPMIALTQLQGADERSIRESLQLLLATMASFTPIATSLDHLPPIDMEDDPSAVIREKMKVTRDMLDRELREQGYQITETFIRLSRELDALLQAYMALQEGQKQQGT